MTNMKHTKRALLLSVLSLILCFSMMLGTTYAWFTDSVTSTGNKIQSGTLKVDLELYNAETSVWSSIKDNPAPIFNYDKWEPGYVDAKLLKVVNEGTLALKWKAMFVSEIALSKLAEVIDVYVYDFGKVAEADVATTVVLPTDRSLAGYTRVGTVAEFVNTIEDTTKGTLEAGEAAYLGIALKMQETAGNEYQNLTIGEFDIQIVATQMAFEEDSFDANYDELADFAYSAQKVLASGASAVAVEVRNEQGDKVGSADVPAGAIADPTKPVKVDIKPTAVNANVTVAAGMEATTFDVDVSNLKDGNTIPVKVEVRIDAGLDPDTVKFYHYATEIPCTYNPTTGYVIFESADFSPFTAVYDAESEYEAPSIPDVDEDVKFAATVTYEGEYVGEGKIEWGNYGQWSPTANLDANLEAAFKFACPDYDTASDDLQDLIDAYRFWYCDFYVSLDKDLAENQIFLGGNYGSFGWVGFHNGDITLKANEEIGLLSSVTTNPWTYNDIESFVSEFICGVGDVNNALDGATFTVKLRLTNPEDEKDTIDVNTVTYKFGGAYEIK